MGQARDEAGNIWETFEDGRPPRLVSRAGGRPPADPTFDLQRPKAGADIASTVTNTEGNRIDNSIKNATRPFVVKQAQANADKAVSEAEVAKRSAGTMSDDQRKFAGQLATLESIVGQINRTQQLYGQDVKPENARNLWGVLDNFGPRAGVFNTAGQGLADQGLSAFRVPGVGSQSDLEAKQFALANTPDAGDWDGQIEEKLSNVRRRVDANRKALGLPPAQWDGLPQQQQQNGATPPPQGQNAMTQTFLTEGGGPGAAPAGSTKTTVPIPKEMQAEYSDFVSKSLGQMSPDEYATYRAGLDAKYGFGVPDATKLESYRQEAARMNEQHKRGGASLNLRIPGVPRDLSGVEKFRNDVVSNPVGAAATGYLDGVGFGGVKRLAPEQMDALGESHPLAMTAGQIGGTITGTGLLGKLGTSTIGRLAPRLMGGAGRAQFARNLAADATYGGVYGGVADGDPLGGALTGAVASAGGQGLGSLAGRTLGGAGDATRRYLQARGVPLTVGQAVGDNGIIGRTVRGLEDRLSGYVGLGDVVKSRHREGLSAWNLDAFNQALEPIGATVKRTGDEGVDDAIDAVSGAYGDALRGHRVPVDEEALQGIAAVRESLAAIPDIGPKANYALDRALNNVKDGHLDGRGFQSAMQRLKKAAADLPKQDAILGHDAADALRTAQGVLEDSVVRNGSPELVEGLRQANAANRNVSVIEDAVGRARNGSRSGEPGLAMPSQLVDASRANAKKFGGRGTKKPLYTIGQAGQKVLPSRIPDSGTAGRLALAAPAGLLGAAGGGYGATQDGAQGAAVGGGVGAAGGAALTALLAAGGSKQAQRLLVQGLIKRGPKVRAAGKVVRKYKGLAGSGAIPLLMNQND